MLDVFSSLLSLLELLYLCSGKLSGRVLDFWGLIQRVDCDINNFYLLTSYFMRHVNMGLTQESLDKTFSIASSKDPRSACFKQAYKQIIKGGGGHNRLEISVFVREGERERKGVCVCVCVCRFCSDFEPTHFLTLMK